MKKRHTKPSIPVALFFICIILTNFHLKAQDTLYFDQHYEAVESRTQAKFMEIKKCSSDNPNKCAVATFSLDSNRIIYNWRYSDFENRILHGRCSRWYANGALLEETLYENGKKQGADKSFYPNGQLKRELQWIKDSLIGGVFLNEDGSPKVQIYQDDLEERTDWIEPSYPGGLAAMYQFISLQIIYPESAKEEGISGKVILSFVVGRKGEIRELKVEETPHPVLSNALLQVIKKMPRWNPGSISGVPVSVRYQLPFKFKLE